ncbi:hypothetical protein Aduo_017612 [Ancylostoma duodenale]
MASTSHPSPDGESGNDADDSEEYEEEDDDDVIQNIYLHICNEEGREFTGVTTFHGMIRIFTSRTWTSLIFWVIVVSTCLVFFMIFSGYILSSYARANTFMRRSSEPYNVANTSLLICGSPTIPSDKNFKTYPSISIMYRSVNCLEMTAKPSKGRLFIDIKEDLSGSEIYLSISPMEMDSSSRIYLRSRHHHRIFVEASQISRLNTTRAPCIADVSELTWITRSQSLLPQDKVYTLQLCERMQIIEWSLRERQCIPSEVLEKGGHPECAEDVAMTPDENPLREFPCKPPCNTLEWRITSSSTRIRSGTRISIEMSRKKEVLVEVRKMGVTDVLSFIGGGTSLFLGCSCVTLMETFIFLLKLVLQSIDKEAYERVRVEDENTLDTTVANRNMVADPGGFDVEEEGDVIASTSMQSPPRKSIHCVRFLSSEDGEENNVRKRLYRPHPPSLSELKTSTAFNELNTHNIERSLKNLPLSQRLTFDGSMDRRRLRRQSAIEIPDEKLDQYLSEPSNTRSFCDDFDRKHPARVKIRRISSVTSRGSASSSRANVHIVEHPRRRSQIYNKFMAMNDF